MKNESRSQPVELLAPAGDDQKLRAAIQYGADAVYLAANKFGLRSASANFSYEELAAGVSFAHSHGVRVYLTLNSFLHPGEEAQLEALLGAIAPLAVDAVIVSDPGVFALVRELAPDLAIHISTQANVTNAAACNFWHRLGARRIILARELTVSQISEIRQATPLSLELEGFVHGSMCVAYSGRCLLSKELTGRDANRGYCAQPCRWPFKASWSGDDKQSFYLENEKEGSFLLSSRDLCLVNHLPDLLKAGLTSLKIEGRAKSVYYVATVVKTYREALDSYLADPDSWQPDPAWQEELNKTRHRPFSTGFYYTGPRDDELVSRAEPDTSQATVVGIVKAWLPQSRLLMVEQRNKLLLGERLELMQPGGANRVLEVEKLYDLEKNPIASTPHPRMLYYLPAADAAPAGAFLRRLRP